MEFLTQPLTRANDRRLRRRAALVRLSGYSEKSGIAPRTLSARPLGSSQSS